MLRLRRYSFAVFVLIVIGLLALTIPAHAQKVDHGPEHVFASVGKLDLMYRSPRCNPLRMEHDAVWIHGEGWTMPSVAWHAMYPAVTYVGAKAASRGLRTLGMSERAARITGTVGVSLAIGILPHIRQSWLGLKDGSRYSINVPDYAFDAWNRSLPVWDMLAHSEHSKREYVTWIVGDLALACWSIP